MADEESEREQRQVERFTKLMNEANQEVGAAFRSLVKDAVEKFGADPGAAALVQAQARIEESRYKHQTALDGLRDLEARRLQRIRDGEAKTRQDESDKREARLEIVARRSMWAMGAAAVAAGLAALPPVWAMVKEILSLAGVKLGR